MKSNVILLILVLILTACGSTVIDIVPSSSNSSNESIKNNELDKEKEFYKLNYVKVDVELELKEISNHDMIVVIDKKELVSGTFYMFKYDPESDEVYGAFQLGNQNTSYDIGIIGNDLHFGADVTILSQPYGAVLKVFFVESARLIQTNYYLILQNELYPLYSTAGEGHEIDLDNDGTMEIVSQRGLPMDVRIAKWIDGNFYSSFVNDTLSSVQSNFSIANSKINLTATFLENGNEIEKHFSFKNDGVESD